MAINALRNKRCGPGGSARRLHQIPFTPSGWGILWGRNRIDVRGKGMVFARWGSAVTGPNSIVANDNYAEARLAA